MNADRSLTELNPAAGAAAPEAKRVSAPNGGDRSADEVEDGPASGLWARLLAILPKATPEQAVASASADSAATRLPRTRREMIERVIAFDEKRVVDVMAPRADIVAVEAETPFDDLVRAFSEAGHSRLPIYRGDLDDPIGIAHLKDVVRLIANPEEARAIEGPVLLKIRRDVLYVPPSMRITDLLLRMQVSRIHMALVIDEYGGTDGLVTIEDLVEQIVGDINDEHDDEDAPSIAPRAGGWDVDARVELVEFAAATSIALMSDDEEIDTLGGLVISLAGRVPQRGEVIGHDEAGLDFEVLEADARKIRKLRIRRRPTPAPVAPDV